MASSTHETTPALFADPCRNCDAWYMGRYGYKQCRRGASPKYASLLGNCAMRIAKTDATDAGCATAPC